VRGENCFRDAPISIGVGTTKAFDLYSEEELRLKFGGKRLKGTFLFGKNDLFGGN
jgi:hypothetical protein